MKYQVKAVIKKVVNIIVDADNEETASEVADAELSKVYDTDTYYEIGTVTRLEDENDSNM